jgi:O-antigen/teichoic acid export membrane protein
MPQNIINATSFGLPVILLTSLFGADSAGQYSITLMAMSAPVVLLGQSVGEVFYPKITRAIQQNPFEALRLLLRATGMLFVVGLVPFLIVGALGDKIFPLVFGAQWLRAGQYSQWAALWMVFVLATRPAVASVPALRMQGALLAYEVLITGARVLALSAGSKFGDDLTSVAAFSLVNVVGYACLLVIVIAKLRRLNKRVSGFN